MSAELELRLPRHEPGDITTGTITFIGTATVLLRYAGFTILTDPNFIHMHEKVGLGYGLTATRQTNPALELAELPPIDFVLLSHYHGDHFDQVAERELEKTLPIITTPAAGKELAECGFVNIYELETWSSIRILKDSHQLRITAMPGRHAPGIMDLAMPDVMGSMLEFQTEAGATLYRTYISGDTLVFDDLKEIPERFPAIDMALLHLGGTVVLGIMVTMDGEQGVELLQILRPQAAIPIHYNDYDVFKSPLSDFQQAVRKAGLEHIVRYLSHGETHIFTPTPGQERAIP